MGTPRAGPRYVGVVEATPHGPTLRPVYVGRMELMADPRTGAQQLLLSALQHALTRGAAIFTLDGEFLGLVRSGGATATVVTAEFLRAAAEGAQPATNQPRGLLGLEVEPLTPALVRPTGAERGVVVSFVDPGGPSIEAVQSGDVIQAIDGTPVASIAAFRQQETSRTPGASVALQGVRRGSPLWVTVTAADSAAAGGTAGQPDDPGFVGRQVPGAGLEVVTVSARSAAGLAGLEPGDLIVAVDGQAGPDSAEIARRYRAAGAGTSLLVTVQRGQRHRVLALEKR
jgi:serine protease Do